MKRILLTCMVLIIATNRGHCWIFPEHRDIMILAIQKLDPVRRAELQKYWLRVIAGHESRLSALVADTSIGKGTTKLDYAYFPAIGGDHSTSAADLVHTILYSHWVLKVSDVAMDLKKGLAGAKNRSDRLNRLRDSDLRLLKADPEYVTRAGANNVHFMLARPEVNTEMVPYFTESVREGCALNAPGTYVWYHLRALRKAATYASDPSASDAGDILFAALADEGFGLHFLEDMFASGHVAGTRGNAAQRKGTHDHYDEFGLEVSTWDGTRVVLMGDAFMRPQDADLAAGTIEKSLEQIIDAAAGKYPGLITGKSSVQTTPDTFNVCKTMVMPEGGHDPEAIPLFREIFRTTAMPGLAKGAGELPRFRAELGPFIGMSAAARGTFIINGFSESQKTGGEVGGLDMNFRLGYGLEGVLNEASDAAMFVEAGYRLDSPSSIKFSANPDLSQFGSYTSAIPTRNAVHLRLRMPFYLIPGDLFILAPLLYLADKKAMSKVIATSGNGGLIPWQAGILSSIGRFQFVLGREIGIYLYGSAKNPDHFIVPVAESGTNKQAVITIRSTALEFPVLEYRPFHTFSFNQTTDIMIQLFGGVDIPGKVDLITPTDIATPSVRSIPFIGLRVVFDWRYYLPGKNS